MSFSSLNVPNPIAAQFLHPAGPARLYLGRCADRAPCSCGRETGRNSGALLIDRAHLNPPSNSGMTLGLSLSPSSRVGVTLKVTGNQQDLFICIFRGSCKKKGLSKMERILIKKEAYQVQLGEQMRQGLLAGAQGTHRQLHYVGVPWAIFRQL